MEASTVSWLFVAGVVAAYGVRTWLAWRQIRHVAANRQSVPAAFAATVTGDAHRKAADYTLAHARMGLITGALATAVLIGWTLLGGLDAKAMQQLHQHLGDLRVRVAALRQAGREDGT